MGKKEQSKETQTVSRTLCCAEGCKHTESRYSFCSEHYDQFKFGLITKLGKKVSDYEKKFDHFESYKKNQSLRKVA